jgi:hypothetical protein
VSQISRSLDIMTGGGFVPGGGGGEEYDLGGPSHAVQWVGTPSVKGPRWAKMPLLTVGMLGIQVRVQPQMRDILCLC